MLVKLLVKNPEECEFPLKMTPDNVPESKYEAYKKLEKFITENKLDEFWKGLGPKENNEI